VRAYVRAYVRACVHLVKTLGVEPLHQQLHRTGCPDMPCHESFK
jgi:hypothetical protein